MEFDRTENTPNYQRDLRKVFEIHYFTVVHQINCQMTYPKDMSTVAKVLNKLNISKYIKDTRTNYTTSTVTVLFFLSILVLRYCWMSIKYKRNYTRYPKFRHKF